MKDNEYKVKNMEPFQDAFNNAKSRLVEGNDEIFFFFNDIKCIVNKETECNSLYNDYSIALTLHLPEVGKEKIGKDLLVRYQKKIKQQEQDSLSWGQIKYLKKSSEEKILEILNKFTKETGLNIHKINITSIDLIDPTAKPILKSIHIETDL